MIQAVHHALGFDEQHAVEGLARRGLEIRGLIDPGVAVPGAAALLDDALDPIAGNVRRPLEVHVLDPVRDAGQPRGLVLRTDLVPAPDRDERRRMLFLDEYLESAVEGRRAHHGFIIKSMDSAPLRCRRGRRPSIQAAALRFMWRDTVNLPRTSFPMKANLLVSEPDTLARWAALDLYGKIRAQRQGAPKFVLHDGPPYANGNI